MVLPTGLLSFLFEAADGHAALPLQRLRRGLTATNPGVAALGALIGTIVGMLPGLGPINGVAILMPLAFAQAAAPRPR